MFDLQLTPRRIAESAGHPSFRPLVEAAGDLSADCPPESLRSHEVSSRIGRVTTWRRARRYPTLLV